MLLLLRRSLEGHAYLMNEIGLGHSSGPNYTSKFSCSVLVGKLYGDSRKCKPVCQQATHGANTVADVFYAIHAHLYRHKVLLNFIVPISSLFKSLSRHNRCIIFHC